MATALLHFQDMTSTLTPPPSDRGECDSDAAMLNPDNYLPEDFYPSPAPSLTHHLHHHHHHHYHRPGHIPHSPDMCQSDTTYDPEEDAQPIFFLNSAEPQIFSQSTPPPNMPPHASNNMSYGSYDQASWIPMSTYPNLTHMYHYPSADEAPEPMYNFMASQAPTTVIPPIPQGVTGMSASFDFNAPINRPHNTSGFLPMYQPQGIRHHSPTAPSTTSLSGVSSRSCSPNLSMKTGSEMQDNQCLSILPHRSSTHSLHAYGIPIRTPNSSTIQAWRCAYPNCTSRAVFTRGCDLRKHYNRHSKHLFCRVDGCPQSEGACITAAQQQAIQAGAEISDPSKLAITGGFSSKKDRARHEAKHNPGIKCEWKGPNGEECGRLFSRMDNMKDHVRRIHNKGQPQTQSHILHGRKQSRH